MTRVRLLLTSLLVLAVTVSGVTYSTFAKWASTSVTVYVNPNNADVSSTAAANALQFAMDVWNTQGGSPFRYVYGGTVNDTNTAYDSRNVILFRNVSNGSTIATTYSWWDSSNRLLDSDIVVWDGGFTFFTGSSGCGGVSNAAYLEDIATHELGHALGLNHSTSADATMYPSYSYCSQDFRTLASDDIAAIRSLYGTGGGGGGSNTAPTVVITSPPNGMTYSQGTAITLAATASDTQDGNLSTSVQWTDNGVSAGTGASLSVTPGSTGSHTYVAKVTDSGNLQGSSQVSITVTSGTGGGGGGGTSAPAMSSPSPGSTLAGSSQTFTWTAGSGVSAYWLSAGTALGGNNLFDLGVGTNRTATITGLPTSGGTIYVRLWWLAGSWGYADYTYTAANMSAGGGGGGGGGTTPVITTPSAGATLAGSSQTFTWTAGSATSFWLYLGRSAGGSDLLNQSTSSLTITAIGLPTDGGKIYARLWWMLNGAWAYADTTYTAASAGGTGGAGSTSPAIATPAANSTLSGSSQTFTWTAGTGATSYWLYVGKTAGSNDLFDRSMGSSLSVTAGGLPTDGRTIYARLWWIRNGAWEYADTKYTSGP